MPGVLERAEVVFRPRVVRRRKVVEIAHAIEDRRLLGGRESGNTARHNDLAVGQISPRVVIERTNAAKREVVEPRIGIHREGKVRAAKARPLTDSLRDALAGERGA